jgi:hypothetical protein
MSDAFADAVARRVPAVEFLAPSAAFRDVPSDQIPDSVHVPCGDCECSGCPCGSSDDG